MASNLSVDAADFAAISGAVMPSYAAALESFNVAR
jgi:hypothetical protein